MFIRLLIIGTIFTFSSYGSKIIDYNYKVSYGYRIIEVKTTADVVNPPVIYIAGEKLYGKGCIPPEKYVYSMNLKRYESKKTDKSFTISAGYKSTSAKYSNTTSIKHNASKDGYKIWIKKFIIPVKNVHYKIIVDGQSTRWNPKNSGGCTY